MPTFTGTSSNDVITPQFVSPGVIATDAALPSDAADFIQGNSGDDTLDGGGGADTLDGGPGSDSLTGGAGDDIFIWNPGGGSDAISGGSGSDTLLFNGSNIGEKIDLSANGAALRVTRDVAVVTIDATSVEKVNVLALGGPDTITVHDLAGSGVKQVAVDFGQQADGANDTVAVVGTAGADQFTLTSAGGVATVGGLSEALTVSHFENLDRLAFDGGGGADTFTLTGSGVGDLLIAQANNGAVRVGFGADNGFGADVSNVGSIALSAGIGDDTISAGNGLATLSKFIFDGGAGNDQITGGDGADSVIGGAGDDTIAGGRGDDTVSMGSGNDIVSWNPGDGSDVVDGGSGVDTLQFNGSNIGEKIDISLNGTGFRLTRDVANIAYNGSAIEQVNFRALGAADTITVHDLAGSGVKQVSLDLFGSPNPATGDGAVDTVNISGAGATRHYTFTASGGVSNIGGLAEKVSVSGAESIDHVVIQGATADDTLTVTGASAGDLFFAGSNGTNATVGFNQAGETVEVAGIGNVLLQGGAGADTMIGSNGVGSLTHFTFDGGGGDDSLVGTDGGDSLNGGAGDDIIAGGRGNDTVAMGLGADTFIWNPGDGSDVVDGGSGVDAVQFNGANIGEKFDLSLEGAGFRFTRDVANITLTGSSVETFNLLARGGADAITLHDLTGSGLKQVAIDLAGNPGSGVGDTLPDTVVVEGSSAANGIGVLAKGGTIAVTGLSEAVTINGAEGIDTLLIRGGAGADSISAVSVVAGQVGLQLFGDAGDDSLAASHGDDTLTGGSGDDRFIFGPQNGHDLVTDFEVHGTAVHGDVVALSGFVDHSFAAAVANHHIVQTIVGVDITDGANVIVTLANVTLASLHANDFLFT